MSHLIKPLLGSKLPEIAYGKGMYLYDSNGKKYIDGCSGAVTANIGHGVPEVIEAIHQQMQHISFVYRSQFTNRCAEQLAEKLHQKASSLGEYEVFFVNSGSEATETALKMVWQAAQERGEYERDIIISRQTSYHGITLGALALSMHEQRRKRFTKQMINVPSFPVPHCSQCPLGKQFPACAHACLDPLEQLIKELGPHRIAAVITEPIVGAAGGAIVPPDGYEARLRAICTKYQICWIDDEVMTGMGRTGKTFAVEYSDAAPDIILLGKGLAAGYAPLAAVLVRSSLIDSIRKGSKVIMAGHTHCANPISAAAGLAVLEYIDTHQLIQNAFVQGDRIKTELTKLMHTSPLIKEVRGRGLLIGVEWNPEYIGIHGKRFTPNDLISSAFEMGMLLYPAGGANDAALPSVIVAPALTITDQDAIEIIDWWKTWITYLELFLEG